MNEKLPDPDVKEEAVQKAADELPTFYVNIDGDEDENESPASGEISSRWFMHDDSRLL